MSASPPQPHRSASVAGGAQVLRGASGAARIADALAGPESLDSSADQPGDAWWSSWLLGIAAALVCLPAWDGEFIWDDSGLYITQNALLPLPDGLYRFWFTNDPVDYYPLTYSTFWLEWRLAGLDPRLYHVTNFLLHGACTMMLLQLLRRLHVPGAWMISLWFAVHPLQVESVAWISQRKTLLGALFGFAAAYEYLGVLRHGGRGAMVRGWLWFALSLAGKPTLITLPVLLWIYDVCRDASQWRRACLRAAPYLLLSLVFGVVGVIFQQKCVQGVDVRGQDLPARLASLGWAAWFYVLQTVRIGELCFIYPKWNVDGRSIVAWLPNLTAMGLLVVAWQQRRHWGLLPWGAWLAYLVTMIPALGITDVGFWRHSFVGDHYVYQSLPALLALWMWGGSQLAGRLLNRGSWRQPAGERMLAGAGMLAACVFAAVSLWRSTVYETEPGLWRETLQKNPRAAVAWLNIGVHEHKSGNYHQGEQSLKRAVEMDPTLYEAWMQLGEIHRHHSDWPAALDAYQGVSRLAAAGTEQHYLARTGEAGASCRLNRPQDALDATADVIPKLEQLIQQPQGQALIGPLARAWVYRATALRLAQQPGELQNCVAAIGELLGRYPAARRDAAEAFEEMEDPQSALTLWSQLIQEAPEDLESAGRAGLAALQSGDVDLALRFLQRAAQSPSGEGWARSMVQGNLGIALMQAGRVGEAITAFQTAAELTPNDPRMHTNLGLACAMSARYEDAIAAFRRVLALDPNDVNGLRDLAWVLATSPLATSDTAAEGAQLAQRACDLTGGSRFEPLDALAAALARLERFDEAVSTCDRAVEIAQSVGAAPAQVEALQQRRELYRQRMPYRESPLQ